MYELCEGSEHRIDSMYHSGERRSEGAEINASLAALKDCIRAKADNVDYDNLYKRVLYFKCQKFRRKIKMF